MTDREKDEEILLRLIDGDCPEDEGVEILARLGSEPELLRLYRRMCEFEAAITELFPRMRGVEPSLVDKITAPPEFAQAAPGGERPVWNIVPWLAAAAAIAVLAGVLASIEYRGSTRERTATLDLSPSSLLSGGGDLPGVLEKGKTINLERGHVGLSLQDRKVRAVIEGPASFSLTDANVLDIRSGRVYFDITPGAKPIRSTVGKYLVEDLGTVFGVTAEGGALEEVVVSEGSVRISVPSDAGAKAATVPAGSGVVLKDGEMTFTETPDMSRYRSSVDHSETVFDWTANLDPELRRIRTRTPDIMTRSGDFAVFSSRARGVAWIDMPWALPTEAGPDFTLHIEATLPSKNGRFKSGQSGISAFSGGIERFFLGHRYETPHSWVFTMYDESGKWKSRRVHELGIIEPDAAFRIHYEGEKGILRLQARTSRGWNEVLSEEIAYVPTFDRLKIAAYQSQLSLKEVKLFSQK